MASVTITHMILLIASLIVAGSVASVFIEETTRLSAAISDQGIDISKEIRTDIEIISDAGSDVYNRSGNDNITLLVKNTGSRQLPAEAMFVDVLVDGQYETNVSITVLDGSTWDSDNVAELQIDAGVLASGDHRVKVIVSGDEEVFTFRT